MRTQGHAGRDGPPPRHAGAAVHALTRWCRRLVGLLVATVLVIGLGAGLSAPSNEAPIYSASEQAQLDAADRYRSLARSVRVVTATEPALVELLTALAEDLDVQAAAVALPRPASFGPSPAPAYTSATASPSPSARAPLPNSTELLTALRESALRSLAEAVDAEPGPARVLASAGARQWERARELGAALDVDPDLPVPDARTAADLSARTGRFAGPVSSPVAVDPTAPAGAASSPDASERAADSTNAVPDVTDPAGVMPLGFECPGTPLGPEADRRALELARTAEQQARYGYQVAAALLPDSAVFLQRAAEHDAAAGTAADQLERRCVEAEPAPAGFALPTAFREDPTGELGRLEEQHIDMYAGHVASVSPETRGWAVVALVAAVLRSADTSTDVHLPALPGIDEGSEPPGDATTGTSVAPEEPTDD